MVAWLRRSRAQRCSPRSKLSPMREFPLLASRRSQADFLFDSTNAAMDEDAPDDPSGVDGTLWTDRYRPKRFTDLLGDEVSCCRLNRAIAVADLLSHSAYIAQPSSGSRSGTSACSRALIRRRRERRRSSSASEGRSERGMASSTAHLKLEKENR